MLLNDFPLILLRCLLCTVIIECAAAFIMGIRKAADQTVVALANILTNPPLVAFTTVIGIYFGSVAYGVSIVSLEIAAVLVEASVYRKVMELGVPDGKAGGEKFYFFKGGDIRTANRFAPIVLSLILNCCSYFGGIIINRYIF